MKKADIAKEVQKHPWVVWVGFIEEEDDEQRKIGYYGKFADSKKGAIGAAKVMIDNTHPYRIIIQSLREFHDAPPTQGHLEDFFPVEDD